MLKAKQWSVDNIGPTNLMVREAAIVEASGDKVLVRTQAVSLNYRDKLVLETGMGLPLQFPFVPASDLAGVVEAVGPDVTRFRPGDRVITTFLPGRINGPGLGDARHPPHKTLGGYYPGVLSDYVTFSEDWFVHAPETLNAGEASTLPCAGLTAWFALIELGKLKAGDKVVIQGTGGVALFGLQIAKMHGAEVIITSANPEKLARVRELGADHGIGRANWAERVLQLTEDYGADHIFEMAAGANFGESLKAVAVSGRISVIGVMDGFDLSAPVQSLLLKSPTVQGISVGHRRALEDLVRAVDRTGLKPVIDRRYTFGELPQARHHLDRGPFGKIVIEF
ncbi:zinc-dependent alcohol dehydrogenase family protein [Rhizobium sullae]|uniref:NADPH:quinone reductase-like Zn-dependent oxidoreductase n=1 Tax=Rhizobium sullae TaxID=50338 RepID=A0A4R3Q216_RHISU|nr:NAD(P)-dependent alcohol dehydrogenase [Rhizobium sullae]TCU14327.1 NADPH:quinone reductase-like Zn-dependent oxidoreductase [Rhizobium sullae]